jgi:putative ABC transport system permease protein
VFELPLPAYLAIALLLIGAIALMPQLAKRVFGAANRMANSWAERRAQAGKEHRAPVPALVLARLANAPGQAAIALGGVLASFSLMVAMAIMVSSFRSSVDDWLLQILPADLYARALPGSSLNLQQQATLQALPGIERVDFMRNRPLTLLPDRPDVMLLARVIDALDPTKSMVMLGASLSAPAGTMPAWVSEAMVDLHGAQPGATIMLPLDGRRHPFFVAGVWRDYAHQGGAIQIRLADYRALSGDDDASDAAISLPPGASAEQARSKIAGLPFGPALTITAPSEIRAISLKIFDRSFAVTYVLEAIAIVIGLFGVAATFSAQTLARSREFGMLRHIGVTRRQILALLALEGGALTGLGIASGALLGWLISLILVFIVNPQSFHWSMQLHLPWSLLATVAGALLVAAALTALLAGRSALSGSPVKAVREDS